MISPNDSGPDDDDLISSPTDITARQQQVRDIGYYWVDFSRSFRRPYLTSALFRKILNR